MGFGVGLGQLIAGLLGPYYGWRLPFMIVALPALVIVLLFALTTSEPKRGGKERAIIDFNRSRNKSRSASRANRDAANDENNDDGGGGGDILTDGATVIGRRGRGGRHRVSLNDYDDGDVDEWGHFKEDADDDDDDDDDDEEDLVVSVGGLSTSLHHKRRSSSNSNRNTSAGIELTTRTSSTHQATGGAVGTGKHEAVRSGESGEQRQDRHGIAQSNSGAELFPTLSQSNTHMSQLLGWAEDGRTVDTSVGARQQRQGQVPFPHQQIDIDACSPRSDNESVVHVINDIDFVPAHGGEGAATQFDKGDVKLNRSDSIIVYEADSDDDGESVLYEEKVNFAKLKTLLSSPTVGLIFLQGIPGSLPWGVMLAFFNDFLSQQKKVPVGSSTGVLITFGLGGACGKCCCFNFHLVSFFL
jgi:hypothetical protein